MSRGVRKSHLGVSACRGEKRDKQIWRKRWRRRERVALTCEPVETLENHLASAEKEVVKVRSMGKESRQRWPLHRQAMSAKESADHQGRGPQERSALRKRFPRKWMGE
ncbi:MAG: hypothetical protein LBO66_13275 [Deltaproteobacteria bacterium]|jgi:hypothetical protein|nr:hypothetical protein [Deltaproteobacteria bacterium]